MATELTQEEARRLLHYDPERGEFWWKVRAPGRQLDRPAGCYNKLRNTHEIRINYRLYKAHRLAFLWMTGDMPALVDHRDCNPRNNAWKNLRPATPSENSRNAKRSKNNTSGIKGVWWHSQIRAWCAEIWVDSKKRSLGCWLRKEDAAYAYASAAKELHGEFARTA
jgi:hypothetical protein